VGILQNYIAPTIITLLLHFMVVIAVWVGWQMNDSQRFKVETPRYVKAKLVTLEQPKSRKTLVERKPPPAPAVKAEPPKTIQRKVQPRQAVPAKSSASASQKAPPKTAPAPKPKPVPKPLAPSSATRSSQDEARVQQQHEMLLALAEEESLMAAEEDEILTASYAALIKQRVEISWSRPPSARKSMQVVLSIRMIPTGEVVGVEVVQGSGNAAFDRAAIAAVERAERFPELSQMPGRVFEAYFRTFTLVFKPEDLLL
jgi:TonB family protein